MAHPHHAIPDLAGRKVFILGLGRSGRATFAALAAAGAEILAWDDQPAARADLPPIAIADPAKIDWRGMAALVISPGIPHTFPAPHPLAAAAKAQNVPLISDVELLIRANPKARVIAITGTNGKSTTTALIGHILHRSQRQAEIGGNLGTAALSLAPLGAEGFYVLELSSYQLEITPSPVADIAVLLNISPDHLDRHGGMAGYIAAKASILRPKGKASIAVIGCDDEASADLYRATQKAGLRRAFPISAKRVLPGGFYVEQGRLIDDSAGRAEMIADLNPIASLPGRHNWQNAAAAAAALRAAGLTIDEIASGLRSYPGLAHRQEIVARIAGVTFVNDSKATNADATAKALACYDDIYWILGGRAKAGGIAGLESFYPRIRRAYLIGEAAGDFARHLGRSLPWQECGTLDRALAAAYGDARRAAQTGSRRATILLSPACASWDQYPNFEARGEHFRQLANEIARGAATDRGAA